MQLILPESLLAKDIRKQRITEDDAKQIKERITTTTLLEDLAEADFVIEAVPVCSCSPAFPYGMCTLY